MLLGCREHGGDSEVKNGKWLEVKVNPKYEIRISTVKFKFINDYSECFEVSLSATCAQSEGIIGVMYQ